MDYERVAIRVKALIASKPSHGRDALLREIVEIEKECELDPYMSQFDDRPRVHRPTGEHAVEHDEGDTSTEHDAASHVAHATA